MQVSNYLVYNMKKYIWIMMLACFVAYICIIYIGKNNFRQNMQEKEEKIILRYGDVNPEGNITVKTARYFARQVNELSKGRIEVDVYSSGVLGDELQSYQQLQMGALDLYRANSASLNRLGDLDAIILSLPYIFKNRKHMWKICSGEIGRGILENIRDSGSQLIGLFYIDEGERNLFTVDKPIHRLSDLKGMRIRAMLSDSLRDTLLAFGATPVQMTYAETYNALQSGEVDGAENPVLSYYSNKFYKEASYYIKSYHMYSPGIVVMSEITWNNLSKEDREIIKEAALKAEEYNKSEVERAEIEAYAALETFGVQVIIPYDIAEWKKAAISIYDKYTLGREELLKSIQEQE